jgi:hypothetical protein
LLSLDCHLLLALEFLCLRAARGGNLEASVVAMAMVEHVQSDINIYSCHRNVHAHTRASSALTSLGRSQRRPRSPRPTRRMFLHTCTFPFTPHSCPHLRAGRWVQVCKRRSRFMLLNERRGGMSTRRETAAVADCDRTGTSLQRFLGCGLACEAATGIAALARRERREGRMGEGRQVESGRG